MLYGAFIILLDYAFQVFLSKQRKMKTSRVFCLHSWRRCRIVLWKARKSLKICRKTFFDSFSSSSWHHQLTLEPTQTMSWAWIFLENHFEICDRGSNENAKWMQIESWFPLTIPRSEPTTSARIQIAQRTQIGFWCKSSQFSPMMLGRWKSTPWMLT